MTTYLRSARNLAFIAMLGVGGASFYALNTSNAPKAALAPVANTVRDPDPMPTLPKVTTTTVASHVAAPKATRSYRRPVASASVPLDIDAVWQCIHMHEASDWHNRDTGHNGHWGGLQFSIATWRSVGGSGNPADASPEEQLARGKILQARSGWGQWATHGKCGV